MKKFFANIWTKRVVSLLSAAYAFMACFLCYCSLFYSIDVHSNAGVCLMTTGISLIGLVAMLYSRKQIITKIASFVILPAMLPFVLFRRVVFDNTYCNNRYFDLSSFGSRRGNKNCIGNCIPSPLHFRFTWLLSCKLTFCYSN